MIVRARSETRVAYAAQFSSYGGSALHLRIWQSEPEWLASLLGLVHIKWFFSLLPWFTLYGMTRHAWHSSVGCVLATALSRSITLQCAHAWNEQTASHKNCDLNKFRARISIEFRRNETNTDTHGYWKLFIITLNIKYKRR